MICWKDKMIEEFRCNTNVNCWYIKQQNRSDVSLIQTVGRIKQESNSDMSLI